MATNVNYLGLNKMNNVTQAGFSYISKSTLVLLIAILNVHTDDEMILPFYFYLCLWFSLISSKCSTSSRCSRSSISSRSHRSGTVSYFVWNLENSEILSENICRIVFSIVMFYIIRTQHCGHKIKIHLEFPYYQKSIKSMQRYHTHLILNNKFISSPIYFFSYNFNTKWCTIFTIIMQDAHCFIYRYPTL